MSIFGRKKSAEDLQLVISELEVGLLRERSAELDRIIDLMGLLPSGLRAVKQGGHYLGTSFAVTDALATTKNIVRHFTECHDKTEQKPG